MGQQERHPRGLYVLFFTEMWERFGFYTMGAVFTKYLRNAEQGFGWSDKEATALNANYLMFVYASPLIGGWIADMKLGYRNSVLIGGLIFMVGYLLFTLPALWAVYAALTCLVIGNGFFKPNVSAMVGHLYPEGSELKDRAYNIFYMGINVGALLAPVVAEFMVRWYGYRPAYAVAAAGMVFSVCVLWLFKRYVEPGQATSPARESSEPAAPPPRRHPIDDVPDWKRITALVVIFLAVIVFWMVFHQNSSTLTYWADENTDWQVSGIISNAINPFWVVTLSLPLVSFWRLLNAKGLEPATPTKMLYGMVLTGLMFFFMYLAAKTGEATIPDDAVGKARYAYKVSPVWLIAGYFILTLGELMLSPMGLSLVSKVAPVRLRGLMMGGWFLATAIGNKLTAIGTLWYEWPHSTFFLLLGSMALGMALLLFLLLRPLKKAMPGV
jgi:POT family proton-dependent oligopeptide transporter